MGWFTKKRTASDMEAEAKAILDLCIEAFKRTWTEINPQASTADELAARIEEFSVSAFKLMFTRFPMTKAAPPHLLWMAVFTAVLEAKTHPTDLVNQAIDVLRTHHAS